MRCTTSVLFWGKTARLRKIYKTYVYPDNLYLKKQMIRTGTGIYRGRELGNWAITRLDMISCTKIFIKMAMRWYWYFEETIGRAVGYMNQGTFFPLHRYLIHGKWNEKKRQIENYYFLFLTNLDSFGTASHLRCRIFSHCNCYITLTCPTKEVKYVLIWYIF